MEQQYGSDFISITDEDGKEYELEILSTIEYQGAEYLALVPAEEDEASEELEVSILKSVRRTARTYSLPWKTKMSWLPSTIC